MRLRVGLLVSSMAMALMLFVLAGADFLAQERPDVENLLSEGLSLLKQGDLPGAREKFEKALLLNPSSEQARFASGVVASTLCERTWPGNSCSNPLTAGLIFAQTGQPGR